MTKAKKMMIGGALYVLFFSGTGLKDNDSDNKCEGTLRWEVKVAADEDAELIQEKARVTTIKELTAYDTDTIPKGKQRQYSETKLYTVKEVLITKAILEDDNDIHLVLEDGKGNHMIAEIPYADCTVARKSKYAKKYKQVRKSFEKYQDNFNCYTFNVTGVFFQDKSHGQTGKAPNDVELHPVMALSMAKKRECFNLK